VQLEATDTAIHFTAWWRISGEPIPIVEASLALFTPAAAACGILIVSRTFGFDEWMLRHATVAGARAS
jgi:hypothetical protein